MCAKTTMELNTEMLQHFYNLTNTLLDVDGLSSSPAVVWDTDGAEHPMTPFDNPIFTVGETAKVIGAQAMLVAVDDPLGNEANTIYLFYANRSGALVGRLPYVTQPSPMLQSIEWLYDLNKRDELYHDMLNYLYNCIDGGTYEKAA